VNPIGILMAKRSLLTEMDWIRMRSPQKSSPIFLVTARLFQIEDDNVQSVWSCLAIIEMPNCEQFSINMPRDQLKGFIQKYCRRWTLNPIMTVEQITIFRRTAIHSTRRRIQLPSCCRFGQWSPTNQDREPFNNRSDVEPLVRCFQLLAESTHSAAGIRRGGPRRSRGQTAPTRCRRPSCC